MPVSCNREKALRDVDEKKDRERERREEDHQRDEAVAQRDAERPPVAGHQRIEKGADLAAEPAGSCSSAFRKREHSIGVSVSDTITETAIVTVTVSANSRISRPMMPSMSKSGMNTATSERLIENTVKPISPAPLSAAVGLLARLDMAVDVLDHDNGVVHHEPDRDGQRHQR